MMHKGLATILTKTLDKPLRLSLLVAGKHEIDADTLAQA